MKELQAGQITVANDSLCDSLGTDEQNKATLNNLTIALPSSGSKLTTAIYAIEKYDFTKRLSLTAGIRADLASYEASASYSNNVKNRESKVKG